MGRPISRDFEGELVVKFKALFDKIVEGVNKEHVRGSLGQWNICCPFVLYCPVPSVFLYLAPPLPPLRLSSSVGWEQQ